MILIMIPELKQKRREINLNKLFTLVLYAFFFASVVGLVVQLDNLNTGNSEQVLKPFVSGVWLCTFTLVFSLQGLFILKFHVPQSPLLYLALAVLAAALGMGYFVGFRIDAGLWAAILIAQLLFNSWLASQEGCTVLDPDEQNVYTELASPDASMRLCSPGSAWRTCNNVLVGLTCFFMVMLEGGCWLQAIGYRKYSPQGTFVTVQVLNVNLTLLTKCEGQFDPALPTFWFEVGGGGHSMSDLWGLRDELVHTYGRRVCSYDMPGTGWSDPAVAGAPTIIHAVMTAMHKEKVLNASEKFILLGTMDDADTRILDYYLSYPNNTVALVPATMGVGTAFGLTSV